MAYTNTPPWGGVNNRPATNEAVESLVRDSSVQRENAGFYAPGQSALNLCGRYVLSTSGPNNIPLHTVPAGKILCLTDLWITYDTATQYDVQLVASPSAVNVTNAIPIFRGVLKGDTAPCEMPGLETQGPILPGTTLWLMFPQAGAATNLDFTISGFEQAFGVG